MFSRYLLLCLSALINHLEAASTTQSTITYSTQLCLTSMGSTKITPVPRTTTATTIHSHVTTTQTTTPTSTFTPRAVIETSTITSTVYTTSTLDPVTDSFTTTATATSTITYTSVETDTETDTYTSTSTVTVMSSTTVSEATGFTPVASEPAVIGAGGGGSNRFRNRRWDRRSIALAGKAKHIVTPQPLPHAVAVVNIANAATKSTTSTTTSYPTQINCSKTVTLVTVTVTTATAAATTTTLPPSTTTVFTTTTSTSTVYSTPADVSTTSTVTTTSYITTIMNSTTITTTTSTTVSTSYVAAPTATYYAVCQDTANQVKTVNGNLVYAVNGYSASTTADSTYDCCAACASTTNCAFSGYSDYNGVCVLFQGDGTCDPTHVDGSFGTTNSTTSGYYIVSNQNCGQYDYDSGLNVYQ